MALQDVLQALNRVEKCGDYYKALCPAHEDKNCSLSISESRDGKVMVKCHAGCDFSSIQSAAKLSPADFFPPQEKKQRPVIDVTYDYHTAAGDMLFQVVRYIPKTFRQRHPKPGGGWIWNMKDVQRVLYHLPKILATPNSAFIHVVEGEKDVEALEKSGLAATCNAGGAGKWQKSYTDTLAGRPVCIIADKDDPGREHAHKVAAYLRTACPVVRVIELPDTGGKKVKDAADFLAAGGTAKEITALAKAAPEWSPEQAPLPSEKKKDRRSETSAANGSAGGRSKVIYADLALEYIKTHHTHTDDKTVILKTWRGGWYRYDGTCYREWQQGDVEAQVMTFLQRTHRENANKNCLANIMANLRSTDLCAVPSHIKAPCWLTDGYPAAFGWMAMKNALVNIDTMAREMSMLGTFEPHEIRRAATPKLFSTFGLDYDLLDGAVDVPMWDDYLSGVQPSAADRDVLEKVMGLMLVPKTYNCCFFLFGEGGTGKSVFLHILTQLVGEDNTCCVPLAKLGERFATFPLTTNLVNVVGDMPTENSRGDLSTLEGVFKDVCDGASIPIERKHQDAAKGTVLARCIFATNSLPHFTDRSRAIWDRLRILPFNKRFRGTGKENRELRFQIVAEELPGIFFRAVAGLGRLLAENPNIFPEHSDGLAEKDRLRAACDHERTFLMDNYAIANSDTASIESMAMYDDYREWTRANGYGTKSQSNFAASVRRVFGIEQKRVRLVSGKQPRVYPGIKKLSDGVDLPMGEF